MEIYIVQQGDDINSISLKFGIEVDRLVADNGLEYPFDLVEGQSLVIAYPKQTHTVQKGDTLQNIADTYQVTLMQILRNNHFLSNREYIYPGENLVISYNTTRTIATNGFAFPFIKSDTLKKTLPELTYLSVYNYTTSEKGEIISYQDETEIIATAKQYGTIPLLLLTTLTTLGVPNIEVAYQILLNEEYQKANIANLLKIIKDKGYYGINMVFNYLSEDNQTLYFTYAKNISDRLKQENLLFFITINYESKEREGKLLLERIDYQKFIPYVNEIAFVKLIWGNINTPPAPVSNIHNIKEIVEYVTSIINSDKVIIGIPIIGYDWQLPYEPNQSRIVALTLNAVMNLANQVDTIIHFDDVSLTPYFTYQQFDFNFTYDHIVWFIDARSIQAINELVIEYNLYGSGIWNIMVYNPQLWSIFNANFDVIKLL